MILVTGLYQAYKGLWTTRMGSIRLRMRLKGSMLPREYAALGVCSLGLDLWRDIGSVSQAGRGSEAPSFRVVLLSLCSMLGSFPWLDYFYASTGPLVYSITLSIFP